MIKKVIVILLGVGLIFAGVAGFLDSFRINGLLFGLFRVDTLHNIIHIVTGVIAIMCATKYRYTKLFFQIFGMIYTFIAIVGFWRGDLFIMQVNFADNFLHIVIGLVALYLGFSKRFEEQT